MPVSKKPRRKAASTKSGVSDKTDFLPPQADRRAMERFMAALVGKKRGNNDATAAAQNIMYDAWQERDRSKRIALAKKALETSPLCADAYVLLAEEDAKSVDEAIDCYRKGVEAGKAVLGPEGFEKYAGHFWGFLETRPYMRARAGLAALLWQLGHREQAAEHYQEMLELNPNDNQGVRYVLAAYLLERNDIKALKKLLEQYEEDYSAAWLYTRVLLAFREKAPDADRLAEDAWQYNSHVPAVLAGRQPLTVSQTGFITAGGADEAGEYVNNNGKAWQTTPGAIEWLERVTSSLSPKRKRRST